MTVLAQVIEVLARHHAAIADEHDPLEPEALLEITENFGNGLGIAPVTGKHVMRDRPAVDHDQADQNLPVARLAVAAVAVAAELGRSLALEIGRGQIVEHHVDPQREQIAQPHKQRLLDLRLARQQLVERAIPLLELAHLDAHPRRPTGLAFRVLAPGGDEAPAAAVADKIALQPPRQGMLAARRRQPIGHQHQGPIAQPHCLAAIAPREPVEYGVEAEFAPHPTGRQHRTPIPRSDRTDIRAVDAIVAGVIAMQQPAQLAEIEMRRQHIPAAEIDDGAMSVLARMVAIGFDHAHVFALDPFGAAAGSDHAQEHRPCRKLSLGVSRR